MDNGAHTQLTQANPQPLVNWKKTPTLQDLKQDIDDAGSVTDAAKAKITEWLSQMEKGGVPPAGTPANASKLAPKLIRKQAEWRYPALSEPFLSSPDIFNVQPVTWEDKKAAQQNQLVLNYQFNTQLDKVKFIDEYVRTAVDEGTVILRVGWEFEEEKYDGEEHVFQYVQDENFAPTIQYLDALKQQDPQRYASEVPEELKEAHNLSADMGFPVRPEFVRTDQAKKTKTVKNRPTVEICNYKNVVVDPTCFGDIKKAKFVGYTFDTSLADMKRAGIYTNLDAVNVEGASILAQPDYTPPSEISAFNFTQRERKKIAVTEYWGFWDINGDGLLEPIVAAWVGSTMVRLEKSPFPKAMGLPFVLVQYLPKRGSTHGEPDGALLEDNQKMLGAVMRGIIDLLGKSANGQTGMRKDMLDARNKKRFEEGKDYEFNPNTDPKQGVYQHQYPDIPNSAQFMLQLINMDAESLTGVRSFANGVSGQALGDVAAAVRGALDAASKRELGILRRLAEGVIQLGRKFIAMNAEFLSPEEVIRVTNEEFVMVRRDDLPGNFDLQLSISTAEEDNNKIERLAFLYQTLGPNGDFGMTKIILADIARLQKMPDLAKKIEAYQPQPDPMQQQLQQLEMQKLMAEIEEIRARAMKSGADAQLAGVKQGTEMAKQGHLKSDTDLKNLQFVEQESGVHQERAIQLVGEQARSQVQLKLIEKDTQREKMQADLVQEYIKGKMQKQAQKKPA